jgi:hypothetical protein
MNKIEKREQLVEMGFEDTILLENPDYDSAIVGYDVVTGKVIYSYDLMIEHLMTVDEMTEEEAIEFIEYNTVRAIPYMGEKSPIILTNFNE